VNARFFFWVIAVAFAAWLALVLATGSSESAPSTDTSTGSEPTSPPPPASTPPPESGQVDELRRELAASRRARARERRGFRRRLSYAIHSSALAGHWLERAFLCVHAGEGSWGANTGNGYYGGLQMDMSFQRAYAGWALRAFGTADHWPASVQVAAAIEAWTARGFYPWPNTARACGLLR
jgi:hypothetical protein